MNVIIQAIIALLSNFVGTVAVVQNERGMSLRDLYEAAKNEASYLNSVFRTEVRIALVADNSIEWIINLLAILISNHTLILISPHLNKDKLRAVIQKGQIQILITDKSEWLKRHDEKHWLSLYKVFDVNELTSSKDYSALVEHLAPKDSITVYSPRNLNKIEMNHTNILLTATKLEEKGLFANTSTYIAYASFAENYIVGLLCPLLKGITIIIPSTSKPNKYVIEAELSNYRPETVILTGIQFESMYKDFIWNSYEGFEEVIERFQLYWLKRRIIKKRLNRLFPDLQELIILNSSINAHIENTLKKIKFPYTITYGSCETGGITSYCNASIFKEGSVGRIVDRNISVSNSGTVMTHAGEINMLAFIDDIGEVDTEDNLFFKFRTDDRIITELGFEFSSRAEKILKNLPFVNDCVITQYDNKLILIVYPDLDYLDYRSITIKEYKGMLNIYVQQINATAFTYQKINEVAVVVDDFSRDSYGRIQKEYYNIPLLDNNILELQTFLNR